MILHSRVTLFKLRLFHFSLQSPFIDRANYLNTQSSRHTVSGAAHAFKTGGSALTTRPLVVDGSALTTLAFKTGGSAITAAERSTGGSATSNRGTGMGLLVAMPAKITETRPRQVNERIL